MRLPQVLRINYSTRFGDVYSSSSWLRINLARALCFALSLWESTSTTTSSGLHFEVVALIPRRSFYGLLVVTVRLFTRPSITFTLQCLRKGVSR